jgi:hypothetical protein
VSSSLILDQSGQPYPVTPEIVEGEVVEKGWRRLPETQAKRAPSSFLFDPMSLMYSLGYKDKRFSLTYDVIRQVAQQLTYTSAIIKHRISQICEFCSPYSITKNQSGLGFQVKHKDRGRKLTASEKLYIADLERFILHCGQPRPNKYYNKRDDFETFTKKFLKDLLELDQATLEVVPDRKERPFEFIAVDGATIRIAAEPRTPYHSLNRNAQNRYPVDMLRDAYALMGKQDANIDIWGRRKRTLRKRVDHVQVIRGQIENVYYSGEMAFCIMNPRTDLATNGYGQSNIELLIRVITAHLYAEQYNLNVFKQGSMPKGVFNIIGEYQDPGQIDAFKRQWMANAMGVQNAWRMPVLSGTEVQWIPMTNTNQEMEYQQWLNYLIKLQSAIWQIDPAELSFELTSGVGQQTLPGQYETGAEWKVKKSKDKGLRPLLRAYAYFLNKHIIDRFDDHFYLDFIGLDELSQQEKLELRQQEVMTYKTLNEVREEEDLDPLENGDTVLNPTYLQYLQMQMNVQMQEQAEQGGVEPGEAFGMEQPAPEEEKPEGKPEEKTEKSFTAESLNKRLETIKSYVEVAV